MLDLLKDVDAVERLSSKDRRRLAEAVTARLGSDWSTEPDHPAAGIALSHLGLSFVVVAGGEYEMGLTEADESEARQQFAWDQDFTAWFERAKREWLPSHRVLVKPFVIMRKLLSSQELERVGGNIPGATTGQEDVRASRNDFRNLSRRLGFRLPSEAELEWLFRDGGRYHFTLDAARAKATVGGDSRKMPSRFGVEELFDGQWAEDDYHADYRGAPATSEPWLGPSGLGVHRGGALPEYADQPEQMFPLIACMRYPEKPKQRDHMRLVRPIPL